MGGRGTFAAGNNAVHVYRTVGQIGNAKILEGVNGKHALPEEAHSSTIYIKLKSDKKTFHELRVYGNDHYLKLEIGYHPEPKLNNGNHTEPILHARDYARDDFRNRATRRLTDAEYRKYKKYFMGVAENARR